MTSIELLDVFERDRDGDVFLVRRRERVAIALGDHAAFELAMLLDQRIAQAVVPGAHCLGDQAARVLRRRCVAALALGTRMIMCTRASADSDSCTCDSIAVAFSCSLITAPSLADLRVVAVARHEDQGGVEAAERITAQEYAHALAFVQIHDAAHGANQLGTLDWNSSSRG